MKRASVLAVMALMAPAAPASAHVIEIAPSGEAAVISHEPQRQKHRRGVATPARSRANLVQLRPHLDQAGKAVALSPRLLEAIAWAESRFNMRAVSSRGAVGAMQLMPATARDLGVDPHTPQQNVRGGARYLRAMLTEFDGDLVRAIAAYNAGPEAVRRYGGVPPYPETRAYVAAVLTYMADATETTP
jgi:soluble lytic murein transglycosylase-like protein